MAANVNDVRISKPVKDWLEALGSGVEQDYDLVKLTSDVTPSPTSEAWNYRVVFELRDSNGKRMVWANGTATATPSDTSVAGTATVDNATPAIVNGRISVTLSGDAADWLDTETATVTVDAGTIGAVDTTVKAFLVTFTA